MVESKVSTNAANASKKRRLMPADIADRLSHQHAVNACLEALEAAALADCAPEQ